MAPYTILRELSDILRVEHRDLSRAGQSLCFDIKIDPIKTPVLGIWVNFEERACVPTGSIPEFLVQKNLNPVADLITLCHTLFAIDKPEHPAANHHHDPAVDRPLWVTGHKAAGQNIDAL